MIEAVFYFALGFLIAVALALVLAPPIAARIRINTRNRLEASVPLTLNEIQADKDQLRAEFAMTTRRLEMSLDQLREKASTQLIEINRKRDELAKLAEEHAAKLEVLADAEERGAQLEADLEAREARLAETQDKLDAVQTDLEERAAKLDQYEEALKAATRDVDTHKEEIAVRDSRLETLDGEVRGERERFRRLEGEAADARREIARLEADLAKERARNAKLAAAVDRLEEAADAAAAPDAAPDAPLDAEARRQRLEEEDARAAALERRVDELQGENVELQADLARALARTGAVLEHASQDNVDAALASLRADNEALARERDEARATVEAQKVELAAAQLSGREDWEVERRENAIVRERINDLAAKVAAMTAQIEGPASPINRILQEARAPRFAPEAYENGEPPRSLADRIRALQTMADDLGGPGEDAGNGDAASGGAGSGDVGSGGGTGARLAPSPGPTRTGKPRVTEQGPERAGRDE